MNIFAFLAKELILDVLLKDSLYHMLYSFYVYY